MVDDVLLKLISTCPLYFRGLDFGLKSTVSSNSSALRFLVLDSNSTAYGSSKLIDTPVETPSSSLKSGNVSATDS